MAHDCLVWGMDREHFLMPLIALGARSTGVRLIRRGAAKEPECLLPLTDQTEITALLTVGVHDELQDDGATQSCDKHGEGIIPGTEIEVTYKR